jgi:uncharacterized protein (DUF2236 family)
MADVYSLPGVARVQRRLLAPLAEATQVGRFPQEQYTDPPGDVGWFGPDSVTWRVHGGAPGLLGGLSSLMLQTLHPLAMAGVADHSDYRERPFLRLSRTASFVSGTTYGSTEVAESLVRAVRALHTKVVGTAPDGRSYSAGDPELLRWVHIAEAASLLRAAQRYGIRPLSRRDADRYFDEMAIVAEKLGATDVPRSWTEVRDYFRDVRPKLAAGEQARDTMTWLLTPIGDDPAFRAASGLIMQAAYDLLPSWAKQLHGIRPPMAVRLSIRPAAATLLTALRIVGGTPPPIEQARARCAAQPTG